MTTQVGPDSSNQKQKEKDNDELKQGCCERFKNEFLSTTWFGIQDSNGETLDLERSFCILATEEDQFCCNFSAMLRLALKCIFWGFIAYAFVGGWIDSNHPEFYMAYLTLWTSFYSFLYQSCSLLATIECGCGCRGNRSQTFLINATWLLFSIASVHGIVVVILYWLLDYDPDTDNIDFFNIMHHAATTGIVLLDGFLLNKTPIRIKHGLINVGLGVLFVMWTIIQAKFSIFDNPNVEGEEDPIYGFVDWNENPATAAMYTFLPVFVAFPLFQVLFWLLSLPNRQYIHNSSTDSSINGLETEDAEEKDQQNDNNELDTSWTTKDDDADDIEEHA